ncbi:CARDB domain-containing protein [Halobaculum sp. EA56]|uniref:CARDB domain-containing protein n=1 Tax=Halobaculum sp. EA56 TaxID=3421648 RepID=UPI003EC0B46E
MNATATTLVVDGEADGDDQYATIQAAVDNASDGETVEVRPGTYPGGIDLRSNISLVAPNGATLDVSSERDALTISSLGSVTVAGFSVSGANAAVSVNSETGDIVLRDLRIRNVSSGIGAWAQEADVTVRNVTIRRSGDAIYARDTSGTWVITGSRIANNSRRGIHGGYSNGDWTIRDSVIRNNSKGIIARSASGDWSVNRNVIDRNRDAEPVGSGIDAADARLTVNATRNWWGNASGPTDRQCGGNVNCSNWLKNPPSVTDSSETVVDGEADGDDEYATIQAAVDNASDGETVVVRNGTYQAAVSVSKDVTIVAPNGATLNGSTDAFTIGYSAEPTIAGFTIVGYSEGIAAQRTVGAWTVRNLTVRNTNIAIAARESKGNWSAVDVTVNRSGTGVDAVRSEGTWTVRDSTFRNLEWWAVGADESAGNWRVLHNTIVDNYLGVLARDTTGRWQVHYNTITGNGGSYSGGTGVLADGAATRGNATLNWWGQSSGATDGQCSGNVTCANPLTSPPEETTTLIVDGQADGDDEYATIQTAIDNASDGDRVVVRNGTYPESVRVDRNVSVIAPNGATLDGASLDDYFTVGILLPAGSAVEPTIAGFTITGFTAGIDARRTSGAWHVRNVTVRNSGQYAVYAMGTTGAWRLTDVHLRGSGSAEWGVLAQDSGGSWAITGGSITGYTVGIDVADIGTTANWSVHRATITDNAEHGIDAEDASSIGDATDNWWGQSSGPTESQCVGNVTCTPALDSPPGESDAGGGEGSDDSPRADIDPRIVTNARASDIEAEEALLLQGVAAIPAGVTVANRSWRFGDGETATGRRVTHRYDSGGTFTVTYSVTTEAGETYTASKAVTIQSASQSFRITSITPVVRGTEVQALTLVEGTEFPLRYTVLLTQPENASRVEFTLGNITHTDTDGSDGWTFPVDPTQLNRDRTLRVRAVNERGPNATRSRRVRVLETPEWFEAFQLQNVATSEGKFVYKRVIPGGGRSSTLPIPDRTSSGASIPIAGKAQSSTVKVVMIVTVDFATAQGTATLGGKITYKLVALKANGKVSGTAVVDLAAGDIERAYLNASASAKAKYPPPPTGIPSPPVGPVPPGVVSIYPIFSAGVNTSAVFDERDEIGPDERVAFEFRKGKLTAEVGAKQEIGKRWKSVRLVLGMSESVRATTPLPGFDTIDGRISAEIYAKAIAYMIKLEVSIPPGDRKFSFKFSTPRLPDEGRGVDDIGWGSTAERSGWTARSVTGDRPPKPGETETDGPFRTASSEAAAPSVASVGAVTNDTVTDESPTVTRSDGGVTVLWSRQSREKSALNGRDVFLSRANGSSDAPATSFSEPVALTDDRVSDVSPAVATTAGNDSLAAFLTFDRRFSRDNVSSPADLYRHGEIRVATNAGGNWSAPTQLTDDDAFDYRPTVAAADGEWVVAWVSDADANLSTRTDQRVKYVRYDSDGTVGPVRTIADARAVTVTSTPAGVIRLAYLAMGNASHNGSVVIRSINPGTGATETVATHEVRRFGGLAVAGETTGWIDLGADGGHLYTASNGSVSSLPLPADVGVPQAVHLTGRADGSVLAHVRAHAGTAGPARVFYTARVDGEWLPVRTYANGTASNLTFWQGDSVPVDGGFLSAFAGKDLRSDQRHDIYVFEQRFQPDIAVNATVADANVSVGEAVTLNYTVRNLGGAAARDVTVAVRNGSETVATRTIATLEPGETRRASVTTTLGPDGTVAVVADPDNRVSEHDERNNSDAVRLALPDLAVRSVSASTANGKVEVTVTVANPTAVTAPATTLQIASGPNASERSSVGPLAPGARRNVTVVLPRDALSPDQPVRVAVDPDAAVSERSTRNNVLTATFPIPEVGISPGRVNYARDPETGALTASVLVSNRGLLPAEATVTVVAERNGSTEVVASRGVTVPGADATDRRGRARVLLPLGNDSAVVANDTVEVSVSAPHDAVAGNNVVSDRVVSGGTLLAPRGSVAVSTDGGSSGNVTVELTRVDDLDGTVTAIRWTVNGSVTARNQSSVRVSLPEQGRTRVAVVLVDDDGLLTRIERPIGRAPNVSAIDSDTAAPTDPDLDGRLEDVNGNGRVEFDDVVELLENLNDPAVTEHPAAFDFNGNGRLDYDDVVTLFRDV